MVVPILLDVPTSVCSLESIGHCVQGRIIWNSLAQLFLPLSPVAEPDSHGFLFQRVGVCDSFNIFLWRFVVPLKFFLEQFFRYVVDARSSFALFDGESLHVLGVAVVRRIGRICRFECWTLFGVVRRSRWVLFRVFQPLFHERFQLVHVAQTQLKSFESTDGRLRENTSVQFAHCFSYFCLSVTETDSSLLEETRKFLKFLDVLSATHGKRRRRRCRGSRCCQSARNIFYYLRIK